MPQRAVGPIIAIDFDGTLVEHVFPAIGDDIGAGAAIRELQQEFPIARWILLTMRHGETLEAAIEWCQREKIELWAANVNPEQHTWSESRKVYAHVYVDDANLGVPLLHPRGRRPYVDWQQVKHILWNFLQEST